MPEGHTIHRLARDLNGSLRAARVRAWSPQGRFHEGAAAIDGRPLVNATAWGKYLFCDFGTDQLLHVHLGLIGKFRDRGAPAPEVVGEIRLRLESPTATWDLSGPTRCALIDPAEHDRITAALGADPLQRRPDVARARAKFAATDRAVGAVLLDQSVIAGIGNVYRAEILFLCGVHPARPARSVSDAEFDLLWSETVRLMRIGVRLGRIVTTDPAEIGRPRSRMTQHDRLYVYHQERCRRCGEALHTLHLGGRPIGCCPTCQPA
ncbi:MAG: Fpg/Nei family DNA glycosylase [Actinomycetes bacterium]